MQREFDKEWVTLFFLDKNQELQDSALGRVSNIETP